MNEPLVFIFTVIASTGGFIVAIALIVFAFLYRRRVKDACTLLLCAAGLMLSVQLLKVTLQVPRPPEGLIEVSGYAMPSGHAAGSAFIAILIIYLSRRYRLPVFYSIAAVVALLALLITASRVFYQVHTVPQVLIGAFLGLVFGCAYIFASKHIERKSWHNSKK